MVSGERCACNIPPTVIPNNLILKVVGAEDLVHHSSKIVRFVPIAMQIDTPAIGEKFSHNGQAFVHKLDVLIVSPDVSVLLDRKRHV